MDTVFIDTAARSRYELHVAGDGDDADGELVGLIAYHLEGDVITLIHTEVLPAFSGQGHASTLARGALDDARARGLEVVPSCPYVAAYITKHPEYADLVRA
ncbi:N-acetyltransferase [Nocardioides oleivorans]|uniref:N-acetyltransferase n=1 Tax=Nocardioides oleivorans TaxID=273676 RepID=A0A4Q2S138_9ACTN|nr:GNAT family N-acetyltransferase [Nocardioides oleivorans]RYB94095.1 N-acetyltransferase [Nocardioides oleivorans]